MSCFSRISAIMCIAILSIFPLVTRAQTTPATPPVATPAAGAAAAGAAAPPGAGLQFQRQGVFDCNPNGAYAQSVGALSATNGVFVPVADATVELNTGILVFKECILREVVDKEAESAGSAFLKQLVTAIQTGRDGNAQYVKNEGDELVVVYDKETLQAIKGQQSAINSAFRGVVTNAHATNYMQATRQPYSALTCGYQGDLDAFYEGRTTDLWTGIAAMQNPVCTASGAYAAAVDLRRAQAARAIQYQQDQWNWGRGFYARVQPNPDPFGEQVLTPASVVQESFQQVLGSGFRRLENANDVGQMVGALFAGIGNQVLSSDGGLAVVTQSIGGQPSYLDQVASESAAALRGAATNAGLQILISARQVEAGYFAAVNAIATSLTQTIGQLRTAESKCWDIIIPKVCTTPLSTTNSCTDAGSNTLQVATSTAFSQAIISVQITPIATTTIANINNSQNALKVLDNLIAGVTNTTSLDAQRVALQQLDQLVAQKVLHTPQDLSTVQRQQQDVQTTLANLVQNTITAWGDSTDVNIGWCNVNNPAVIQFWAQQWKK